MKPFKTILLSFLFITIYFLESLTVQAQANFVPSSVNQLDHLAESAMAASKTPGLSIAVLHPDGTLFKNYGFSNEEQQPVTSDTLFELGSMSKAFTGLGILYLEQQGYLRLSDPIKTYLPWLTFNYHGTQKGNPINGEVPVTIEQVLHQTSGIPPQSIGTIPQGSGDDALEETVRTLNGTELDFYPGTKFSYATLNYDILGLIIQEVAGQSYEDFITEKILVPLGLRHTYMSKQKAVASGLMAQGYKTQFLQAKPYAAPEYRGNTPAGYIISNAKDMLRWMQIQLGQVQLPQPYQELIDRSHVGNTGVAPVADQYYAAGWQVQIRGESIRHGGSNPNFSSMIYLDLEKKVGICVLANQNSNAAQYISENFMNLLNGRDITKYHMDVYQAMDLIFTCILLLSFLVAVLYLSLLGKACYELIVRKRQASPFKVKNVADSIFSVFILLFYSLCIYFLPNVLLARLPWSAVYVWGSKSILYGCAFAYFAGIIFILYVLIAFHYPKPKEKNYVSLIPLSVLNGLASALIIFTINESFNRDLAYSKELLIYFLFSLLFFIYTIKLTQGKLITITNQIAYEKRVYIIDKIMHSSFWTLEKIGSAKIYSGLNNDTEALSRIPNIIVTLCSNVLTLFFCLAFLYINNFAAFAASIIIIGISCGVSFFTSRIAAKYWEKSRDIKDIYFRQMDDLVNGFKELLHNRERKKSFWEEMLHFSKLSANLSRQAAVKYLNFRLYNQLMYNIIFGVVVFAFPMFLVGIQTNDLRQTLFLVFYLIGPFMAVVNTLPNLTEVKVNLARINQLIKELDNEITEKKQADCAETICPQKAVIKFENIMFRYTPKEKSPDAEFSLGPINMELKGGEVTFITGGNGSGKSTLGRLITGLYTPQHGRITLNGAPCCPANLNDLFTAVYCDFHLFNKLYGIDPTKNREDITSLLEQMGLSHKVCIDPAGQISSLNLSTGQKKRLAYIISCLDDKPFMLFDEWAAEQDPTFRHYFYTVLLAQLKQKGKGIVVITHDDRYFARADHLIKLDRGVMV